MTSITHMHATAAHRAVPLAYSLTSPSAMALASTARKAQPAQQHSLTAASVADMLADRLNDRYVTVVVCYRLCVRNGAV
jgi:hypothetical protein